MNRKSAKRKRGDAHEAASILIEVSKADVPAYLRSGEFYRSLSEEDDDQKIQVPGNTLKPTSAVKKGGDAIHLLSSLRFWGVEEIPDELCLFCVSGKALGCEEAMLEFARELTYLNTLIPLINWQYTDKVHTAAQVGDVRVLDYLRRNDYDICVAAGVAAKAGHAHILRYLHSQGLLQKMEWLKSIAINAMNLDCVKVLCEFGTMWPRDPCGMALASGSLEMLQFVHAQGCAWLSSSSHYIEAISRGHLECIKYADEHGCPRCEDAIRCAAGSDHPELIEYFLQQGHLPTEETCAYAAQCGKLASVMYLREQGCPWNERTFKKAIKSESLAIILYAYENGCPWSADVTTAAADSGLCEVLSFLVELGCPLSAATSAAAAGRCVECLAYLHEQQCPWDESTCMMAAFHFNVDCLRYAHENGCPLGPDTLKAARERQFNQKCINYAKKVLGITKST